MVTDIKIFRGGVRWGGVNLTWPFVTMTVSNNGILLTALSWKWIFDKEHVKSVEKYKGLFSKGIRIYHTIPDYPKFVVFWTFSQNEVMDALLPIYNETSSAAPLK